MPATVEVFVLPTGYLWLPDRWIFADGDLKVRHLSPDFSFLIRHASGKNVLFDLGMRKVSSRLALRPCGNCVDLWVLGPGQQS